jgi:hypothetical protein
MNSIPKLTTKQACRVARLHPDRINEYIAAGTYTCAPKTVAGRVRIFEPDDMIGLWLFRELTQDGHSPTKAARIACVVMEASRCWPNEAVMSCVENYFDDVTAMPHSEIPDPTTWETTLSGDADIRKVTSFNVGKIRRMIAHYTAKELNVGAFEQ